MVVVVDVGVFWGKETAVWLLLCGGVGGNGGRKGVEMDDAVFGKGAWLRNVQTVHVHASWQHF